MDTLPKHPIWEYFKEISRIPRPSGKEEKILKFLINFAESLDLKYMQDKVGNLLIMKPSSSGKEKVKTVILQSHVDMVCEKNMDIDHDFDNDQIEAIVEGDWIKAKGTTLGADDGIGIASQMAVLAAKDIEHGPIECLFTIDEESGMTGAKGLQADFLKGKILLNLDSEDEGELFIGCAGGIDTVAKYSYESIDTNNNSKAYKILVNGLKGGHSGDEINKDLGNSIKILNRFLWQAVQRFGVKIHLFNGGNLRNAIPREAYAVIVVPEEKAKELEDYFYEFVRIISSEYIKTEPNLRLLIEKTDMPGEVLEETFQLKLLSSLYACPHGALSMSKEIPGLVETSTNLASIKFQNERQIKVTTSQRSSVESAKMDAAWMVESAFSLSNAKIEHSGGYPGWTPDTSSEILKIARMAYGRLFKTESEVKAIHAGLECGLFFEKYPELDMVSFGPTIRGAHSPDERLHIGSTYKFWDLLIEILKNIPEGE